MFEKVKLYLKDELRAAVTNIINYNYVSEADCIYIDELGNIRLITEFSQNDPDKMNYQGKYAWKVVYISANGENIRFGKGSKYITNDVDKIVLGTNLTSIRRSLTSSLKKVTDRSIDEIIQNNLSLEEEIIQNNNIVKPEIFEEKKSEIEGLKDDRTIHFSYNGENTYFSQIYDETVDIEKNTQKTKEYLANMFGSDLNSFNKEFDSVGELGLKRLSTNDNLIEHLEVLNRNFDLTQLPDIEDNEQYEASIVYKMHFSTIQLLDLFQQFENVGEEEIIAKMKTFFKDWNVEFTLEEDDLSMILAILKNWDTYQTNSKYLKSIGFSLERYVKPYEIDLKRNANRIIPIIVSENLQNKVENLERVIQKDVLIRNPNSKINQWEIKKYKNGRGVNRNQEFKSDLLYEYPELLNIDFNENLNKIIDSKSKPSIYDLKIYSEFANSEYFDLYEKYYEQLNADFPELKMEKYKIDDIEDNNENWDSYNQENIKSYIDIVGDKNLRLLDYKFISKYFTPDTQSFIKDHKIPFKNIDDIYDISREVKVSKKYNLNSKVIHENLSYIEALTKAIEKDPSYCSSDIDKNLKTVIDLMNTEENKLLETKIQKISKGYNFLLEDIDLSYLLGQCNKLDELPELIQLIKNNIDDYEKIYNLVNKKERKMNKLLRNHMKGFSDSKDIKLSSYTLLNKDLDFKLAVENFDSTLKLLNKLYSDKRFMKRFKSNISDKPLDNIYAYIKTDNFIILSSKYDTFNMIVDEFDNIFNLKLVASEFNTVYQGNHLLHACENFSREDFRDVLHKLKEINVVPSSGNIRANNGFSSILSNDHFIKLLKDEEFIKFAKNINKLNPTEDEFNNKDSLGAYNLALLMQLYKNQDLKNQYLDSENIVKIIKNKLAKATSIPRKLQDGIVSGEEYEQLTSIESLNSADLITMDLLMDYLSQSGNCDAIGDMLERDILDMRSEYGGVISISDDNILKFTLDYNDFRDVPLDMQGDGHYITSKEMYEQKIKRECLLSFHFHSVNPETLKELGISDLSEAAGPSSGGWMGGGDLNAAKFIQTNDIVITLLPEGHFNVKFYGPHTRGLNKVIDLGIYKYTNKDGVILPNIKD